MTKLLIFYTSSYPYSDGEVFAENEIRILEKHFDKIIIICAVDKKTNISRYLPSNAEVFIFNENISFLQKLKSFAFIFTKTFWQELSFCKKTLKTKFSPAIIRILLIDIIRGYLLNKYTKKILKKQAPCSNIYAYSYWLDYKAVACAFLKKSNPEYTAFARGHRWDIYFYANSHNYLPLRKLIFDNLNAVFCISDDGYTYLRNILKLTQENIYVSRLGTFNLFAHNNKFEESETFEIASCSNLIPVKRVDLIIEALTLINNKNIKWTHFGDGYLMHELKERAKKLLNKPNISFEFAGQIPNEEILRYYNTHKIDLFLNVSESEGIPVSIMEALSFGIPVIATAVGGTPEIIKNNHNGYLLSDKPSPEAVSKMIMHYFSINQEEKLLIRTNAYNTWKENYNALNNYDFFVKTLFSLKKKTLILFSSHFPFEPFETYLESEIKYLINSFDSIYIFSQSNKKSISFNLPSNIKSINNNVTASFLSKIYAMLSFNIKLYMEEAAYIKNILGKNFNLQKQRIFIMEYWKAQTFARPVSALIKKEIFKNNKVYIYSYWNDYKAISASMLKKRNSQTIAISRAHGWDVYMERNTENYLPLKKFMSTYLDGIYCVSENGKRYFKEKFNIYNNTKLARLGVEKNYTFKNRAPFSVFNLVSCSNLIPLKRIELIIEAIALIPNEICINWSHLGDGAEYQKISQYAKEKLESKKNITYKLLGFLRNSEINEIYKKDTTNLFINTSSTEGLPLSMMEAMSYGIPVIGTNVGGVSEIIEHKNNGWLLQADPTTEEIAKAISYFYHLNPDDYNTYRHNAYETWKTKYDAEINYPAFINDFSK